jgi:hypothetical protein
MRFSIMYTVVFPTLARAFRQHISSTRYPTRHRWQHCNSKEVSDISVYLTDPVSPYLSTSTSLDTEEVAGSSPIVSIVYVFRKPFNFAQKFTQGY